METEKPGTLSREEAQHGVSSSSGADQAFNFEFESGYKSNPIYLSHSVSVLLKLCHLEAINVCSMTARCTLCFY